jgi:hypothetical protein
MAFEAYFIVRDQWVIHVTMGAFLMEAPLLVFLPVWLFSRNGAINLCWFVRPDMAVGWRPRMLGGDIRGLATILIGGAWASLLFPLTSFMTPRGHDASSQATSVSPHAGRGLFTVTTWLEQCASSRSMSNSSGTRYPPQLTWSSTVSHVRRPINHWPLLVFINANRI